MPNKLLLIVSGSIAAYKTPDLIRRLREHEVEVTCVLTSGGAQFVTPLALASVSGNPVYSELFSLKDETEMGHIRLSRENDLVAVVPASADIMARMVAGRADDLAATVLLATDKPVIIAPAMNVQMWHHPATQRNVEQLRSDGIEVIEPAEGELACGEIGRGRLEDLDVIANKILARLKGDLPLKGRSAIVTSGPTYEPLDPVRFIGNRSSGKQGHAIAAALAAAGADVTLVAGPVALADPKGVNVVHVETAQQMLAASEKALPADIAICAAAVADWKAKNVATHKLKKRANASPPSFELEANPDILRMLSTNKKRPALVVGFAAETESLVNNATAKRKSKGCDWIVANDVAGGKVFEQESTSATLITEQGLTHWEDISKQELASKLCARIIEFFTERTQHGQRKPGKAAARR